MEVTGHPDPVADQLFEVGSRTYSGPELAEAVGITYRRIDYYTRVGLLQPTRVGGTGSGSRRIYDETDLVRARLVGALLDMGAEIAIAGKVLEQLPVTPADWPEYFFITHEGLVKRGLPLPAACWWIASRELRGGAAPALGRVA